MANLNARGRTELVTLVRRDNGNSEMTRAIMSDGRILKRMRSGGHWVTGWKLISKDETAAIGCGPRVSGEKRSKYIGRVVAAATKFYESKGFKQEKSGFKQEKSNA